MSFILRIWVCILVLLLAIGIRTYWITSQPQVLSFYSRNSIDFTQVYYRPFLPRYLSRQMLWGYLSIPKIREGYKLPVVIMISGSGGIQPWEKRYVHVFNQLGIATFQIDSFTPRFVKQTISDQSLMPLSLQVEDAWAGLYFLAGFPQFDANRIAVMGWSKGGTISLLTAFRALNSHSFGKAGLHFAAHIAFYPACNLQFSDWRLDGAPWLYIHGAKDDYTNPALCLDWIARAKQVVSVWSFILPDAYHAFDSDEPITWLDNAQNPAYCLGHFTANWQLMDAYSGLMILSIQDLKRAYANCMSNGAHLGYNAEASHSAMLKLIDFTQTYLMQKGRDDEKIQDIIKQ